MPPFHIPNGPELNGSPDATKKPNLRTLGSWIMYVLVFIVLSMGGYFGVQKDRYQKGYQMGINDARKNCDNEKAFLNTQLSAAVRENDSLRNENVQLKTDNYETILNNLDIQRGKATITIKQKKP